MNTKSSIASIYHQLHLSKPYAFELSNGSIETITVTQIEHRSVTVQCAEEIKTIPFGHFSGTTDQLPPHDLVCQTVLGKLRIGAEINGERMHESIYSKTLIHLDSPQSVRLTIQEIDHPEKLAGKHVFPLPDYNWNFADNWATPVPYGSHMGIDLNAPKGYPIQSVCDGRVVDFRQFAQDEPDDFWGNNLTILGDDGILYSYSHHDSLAPEIAIHAHVAAGQLIGTIGKSGFESMIFPPHLHFEMIVAKHPEKFHFAALIEPEKLPTPNRYIPAEVDGFAINPYPYLLDWYTR